uniref:Huntingtin n=1 Tax=Poecilia latipinna TaxID=48699 RepID=A0A3B3VDM6_9TELE
MATMEKLMKAFESLKSFQQQQGPPTAEELPSPLAMPVSTPPPPQPHRIVCILPHNLIFCLIS